MPRWIPSAWTLISINRFKINSVLQIREAYANRLKKINQLCMYQFFRLKQILLESRMPFVKTHRKDSRNSVSNKTENCTKKRTPQPNASDDDNDKWIFSTDDD